MHCHYISLLLSFLYVGRNQPHYYNSSSYARLGGKKHINYIYISLSFLVFFYSEAQRICFLFPVNREKSNTVPLFLEPPTDTSSHREQVMTWRKWNNSRKRMCWTTKVTLRVRAGQGQITVRVKFQSTCREMDMKWRKYQKLCTPACPVRGPKMITQALSQTQPRRPQMAVEHRSHSAEAGPPDPAAVGPCAASQRDVIQPGGV